MNEIQDAFAGLVDAIILDNALTRSQAGDVIETFGPTLPGVVARDWIDAVAAEYNRLGIINNPTWSSLRNGVITDGDVASKLLFIALLASINALPESAAVNAAVAFESNAQTKATIPANLVLLEGFKTGDPQLDDALDVAIAALVALDLSL